MRIAVLSSFNVDPLRRRLADALLIDEANVSIGRFGGLLSEALDLTSPAFRETPDAIVVIPAAADVIGRHDPRDTVDALLARFPVATIYVVTVGVDHLQNEHVLLPLSCHRGQVAVENYLRGVRELSGLSPRIVVVDFEWHAGAREHFDARLWYLARMRLDLRGLSHLARLVATHIKAGSSPARKVLAVDLDNTLWGGVLGEDGPGRILIGGDGVGLAYQDFQRELLAIRDTGVLLVVVSKNDPGPATAVLDEHPEMVVRTEHLTAWEIGWSDKPDSLVNLAAEFDLSLDSFVFIDDEPRERVCVRAILPDVAVPNPPADPALRPAWLRGLPYFRRIALTDADRKRPASYAAESARRQVRKGMSREEYLESLDQHVEIKLLDHHLVARAAQLSQRTNQFNLTNRRYTVAEVERLLADETIEPYMVSVYDRFGSNDDVGLIVLCDRGRFWLDEFLLSCRVLGRGVEEEMLAFVVARAETLGLELASAFNRTDRNSVGAEFYENHADVLHG